MIFVELTPFVAFREEYWPDEDLPAMQNVVLVAPDAGDLIRGQEQKRRLDRAPAQSAAGVDEGYR